MLVIIDGYLVSVPDAGTASITSVYGAPVTVNPHLVIRVDNQIESRNEVTQLIDGTSAVRLVGDDNLATGTLTVLFTDDTSMLAARALLSTANVFTLDVPERPAVNMTFVREGSLTPGMHDERRDLWEFQVGFREVAL